MFYSQPPVLFFTLTFSPVLSNFLIKICLLKVCIIPGIDLPVFINLVVIKHGKIAGTHGRMDKKKKRYAPFP